MILRLLLTFIILALILLGVYDYLENIDENDCTMTYMRSPVYIPINQGKHMQQKFPRYKLYLHCGSEYCDPRENVKYTRSGNVPVLFITGNADSHSVVRSISSISLAKSQQDKSDVNFNFFTISFNEELSALYGPVLKSQTKFVQHSIRHILSLYTLIEPKEKQPKSVLLIANSMGGLIAKAALVNSDLHSYVHTIITTASPHKRPVINFDASLNEFYKTVDKYWSTSDILKNVVLVSLAGGNRDILVRTGLVDFDENVLNRTKACVISQTTTSIPYVWRSIDHKCMSWCKELVLVTNRALFNMIDKNTHQLINDRAERQKILSNSYINEKSSMQIRTKFPSKFIQISNTRDELNIDINEYNQGKEKIFALDLKLLNNSFNGLFIYTNLAKFTSFLACTNLVSIDLDNYECIQAVDLFNSYGQSIPPNELGKDLGLKVFHIENLIEFKQKYEFILVIVPQWKKSKVLFHQPIVKFDWYSSESRLVNVQVPKLNEISFELKTQDAHFYRIYLHEFTSILQSFQVLVSCEMPIRNHILKSCVQVKFNEKPSRFYYSQVTNLKSKNLILRLAENIEHTPYLDVYIFNSKHFASNKEINKKNEPIQVTIKVDFISILGQSIRFYALLLPAFLVFIIQLKIFSHMNQYKVHLATNLTLISLVYLNLNFISVKSDFEILKSEKIFSYALVSIVYLASFAISSLASYVFSILFKIIQLVLGRVLNLLFNRLFSKESLFGQILFFVHFISIMSTAYFCSSLAHCFIFYSELLYLVSRFSSGKANMSCVDYSRLMLIYLLIVLKLPALIVWSKSLQFHGVRPLFQVIGDSEIPLAIASCTLYLLNYSKRTYSFTSRIFNTIDKTICSFLICLNAIATLFYSCLNLHLLSYFIMLYLFLILFYDNHNLIVEQEKEEEEARTKIKRD